MTAALAVLLGAGPMDAKADSAEQITREAQRYYDRGACGSAASVLDEITEDQRGPDYRMLRDQVSRCSFDAALAEGLCASAADSLSTMKAEGTPHGPLDDAKVAACNSDWGAVRRALAHAGNDSSAEAAALRAQIAAAGAETRKRLGDAVDRGACGEATRLSAAVPLPTEGDAAEIERHVISAQLLRCAGDRRQLDRVLSGQVLQFADDVRLEPIREWLAGPESPDGGSESADTGGEADSRTATSRAGQATGDRPAEPRVDPGWTALGIGAASAAAVFGGLSGWQRAEAKRFQRELDTPGLPPAARPTSQANFYYANDRSLALLGVSVGLGTTAALALIVPRARVAAARASLVVVPGTGGQPSFAVGLQGRW